MPPFYFLGFCTQKLSKDLVAHIAVYVNLDLDNSMCVYEGKHISNLIKDSIHDSPKTSKT